MSFSCPRVTSSAITVRAQSVSGCWTCSVGPVPGHVNHCGLIPFDGVVVLPCMLCYCRLLRGSFPADLLVFSQPGLQSSPGLTNLALATTAGDSIHHLGLLLTGRGSFTLVSTEGSDRPALKITPSFHISSTPA